MYTTNNKGFTLIELMVSVAILGVLSTLAMPTYLNMQLRTKRAELPLIVTSIRNAEFTYHQEWSSYVVSKPLNTGVPQSAPDTYSHEWPTSGESWESFKHIGFKPEVKLYGVYMVTSTDTKSVFNVSGKTDIDGDSLYAEMNADDEKSIYWITPESSSYY